MPTTLHHQTTPFDSRSSIAIAVYLTLIGYGVQVAMPVISSARMTWLGFDAVEVGRIAGADLGGLALGALLAALGLRRGNWRILVVSGVLLVLAANLLCMRYPFFYPTLWLRGVAGIGAGLCAAVGVASLGACSRPSHAYNIMLFAFAF